MQTLKTLNPCYKFANKLESSSKPVKKCAYSDTFVVRSLEQTVNNSYQPWYLSDLKCYKVVLA